jgi:hypothetical protein
MVLKLSSLYALFTEKNRRFLINSHKGSTVNNLNIVWSELLVFLVQWTRPKGWLGWFWPEMSQMLWAFLQLRSSTAWLCCPVSHIQGLWERHMTPLHIIAHGVGLSRGLLYIDFLIWHNKSQNVKVTGCEPSQNVNFPFCEHHSVSRDNQPAEGPAEV